jgi:hypothetical protein
MRRLLPIALVWPLVACSTASNPPSTSLGSTKVIGTTEDGAGAAISSVSVAIALPVPQDATHRYVFWGTSTVPDVAVAEILPPTNGVLRVAWHGPRDAPIALHVLAYDADPASGLPVAWPGSAERDAQVLEPGDTWAIALAPVTSGSLAMLP